MICRNVVKLNFAFDQIMKSIQEHSLDLRSQVVRTPVWSQTQKIHRKFWALMLSRLQMNLNMNNRLTYCHRCVTRSRSTPERLHEKVRCGVKSHRKPSCCLRVPTAMQWKEWWDVMVGNLWWWTTALMYTGCVTMSLSKITTSKHVVIIYQTWSICRSLLRRGYKKKVCTISVHSLILPVNQLVFAIISDYWRYWLFSQFQLVYNFASRTLESWDLWEIWQHI